MTGTTQIGLEGPPMEAGDRLTREEFERRWKRMPQVKKAELIQGVVYMPIAVRYRGHGRPHTILSHWLHSYRRHGVREYVVWRVFDRAIDWFVLREGNDDRLSPDAGGVFKSLVFPGLWLDAPALVRNDLAALVATANRGLTSPEHGELVARLQEKRAGQ